MHIGLNLIYLVPGDTGGTETYARELIPEMVAAAPGARFTAFVAHEGAADRDAPWNTLIESVTVPVQAQRRAQWVRGEQLLLPRAAARAGVEVLHSLANTAPVRGRYRRVVTIHDLHHRLVPEAHLGGRALGMRALVTLAVRRTDRVLTDSAATAGDVQRLLGVPGSRLDVVPLGLGTPARARALDASTLRERFRLDARPIVLCVAAKRPHKNLIRLIGALALIPVDRRPQLVLAGYRTPHQAELQARARALGVQDDVHFLDWMPEPELEGLYAAARACVFPSLHEGFGLPVIEAMARGVAVACSSRGALAEVAGDAALTFAPESEPEIAVAIQRLLDDDALVTTLQAAGRRQAARFDWATCARERWPATSARWPAHSDSGAPPVCSERCAASRTRTTSRACVMPEYGSRCSAMAARNSSNCTVSGSRLANLGIVIAPSRSTARYSPKLRPRAS